MYNRIQWNPLIYFEISDCMYQLQTIVRICGASRGESYVLLKRICIIPSNAMQNKSYYINLNNLRIL